MNHACFLDTHAAFPYQAVQLVLDEEPERAIVTLTNFTEPSALSLVAELGSDAVPLPAAATARADRNHWAFNRLATLLTVVGSVALAVRGVVS